MVCTTFSDISKSSTRTCTGQTIAVAHDPPRVTLHSIQDGHQERSLAISPPLPAIGPRRRARLTGIWWLTQEKKESNGSIPDIFKRDNIIVSLIGLVLPAVLIRSSVKTGSAHSMLKGQPLLDPLQDDFQPLT